MARTNPRLTFFEFCDRQFLKTDDKSAFLAWLKTTKVNADERKFETVWIQLFSQWMIASQR